MDRGKARLSGPDSKALLKDNGAFFDRLDDTVEDRDPIHSPLLWLGKKDVEFGVVKNLLHVINHQVHFFLETIEIKSDLFPLFQVPCVKMLDGFIRARITGRVDDALAVLVCGDYGKRFALSYIIDGIVSILLAPIQQKIRIRGLELHSNRYHGAGAAGHCVFFL
jgi:hypothetical protein